MQGCVEGEKEDASYILLILLTHTQKSTNENQKSEMNIRLVWQDLLSTIYMLVDFFNFLITCHRLFLKMKVKGIFLYYLTLKIGNMFSFL